MSRSDDLAVLHEVLSAELTKLERYFQPEMKLSLIARMPGNPERELVVTNDDLDDLALLIERMKSRGEAE